MVAKKSGYRLEPDDIPIVRGMILRNDRRHDIAAWFGVNQGRIPGAENGDYGNVDPAPAEELPPSGPPGIKGRRLRDAIEEYQRLMAKGDAAGATAALVAGAKAYDTDEP
jgi:hypothetical protein